LSKAFLLHWQQLATNLGGKIAMWKKPGCGGLAADLIQEDAGRGEDNDPESPRKCSEDQQGGAQNAPTERVVEGDREAGKLQDVPDLDQEREGDPAQLRNPPQVRPEVREGPGGRAGPMNRVGARAAGQEACCGNDPDQGADEPELPTGT